MELKLFQEDHIELSFSYLKDLIYQNFIYTCIINPTKWNLVFHCNQIIDYRSLIYRNLPPQILVFFFPKFVFLLYLSYSISFFSSSICFSLVLSSESAQYFSNASFPENNFSQSFFFFIFKLQKKIITLIVPIIHNGTRSHVFKTKRNFPDCFKDKMHSNITIKLQKIQA